MYACLERLRTSYRRSTAPRRHARDVPQRSHLVLQEGARRGRDGPIMVAVTFDREQVRAFVTGLLDWLWTERKVRGSMVLPPLPVAAVCMAA